jgi:hypothetical protein
MPPLRHQTARPSQSPRSDDPQASCHLPSRLPSRLWLKLRHPRSRHRRAHVDGLFARHLGRRRRARGGRKEKAESSKLFDRSGAHPYASLLETQLQLELGDDVARAYGSQLVAFLLHFTTSGPIFSPPPFAEVLAPPLPFSSIVSFSFGSLFSSLLLPLPPHSPYRVIVVAKLHGPYSSFKVPFCTYCNHTSSLAAVQRAAGPGSEKKS